MKIRTSFPPTAALATAAVDADNPTVGEQPPAGEVPAEPVATRRPVLAFPN